MKGSMTIEAAYIIPFCLFILEIVCFLGIFEYNKAVVKMTCYECILLTMEDKELAEQSLEEALLKLTEQTLKERTLGLDEQELSVKLTETKVLLKFQGNQKVFHAPMEVTVVYERKFPELILRMLKGNIGKLYERNAAA